MLHLTDTNYTGWRVSILDVATQYFVQREIYNTLVIPIHFIINLIAKIATAARKLLRKSINFEVKADMMNHELTITPQNVLNEFRDSFTVESYSTHWRLELTANGHNLTQDGIIEDYCSKHRSLRLRMLDAGYPNMQY